MRVTANTFPDSLVEHLSRLATRQTRLQNEAATGQRLQSPADDPAAFQRVIGLQTSAKALAQHQHNIARLQETAAASQEAIKALKRLSDRVGELATQADGLKSREDLRNYATEVTELIKQVVQVANSKARGSHLFGGTASDQPPFVMSFDAEGRVTAVTYQGNTSLSETEIDEAVTLNAQAVGANTTGTGPRGLLIDSRFGVDFFNHLISFQNNLLAGDVDAIANTDRPNLLRDEENILMHLGANGAVQARLEVTVALLARRGLALESSLSDEADADLAQTLVRLQQTQTAFEAALGTGSNLLRRSLLDYLR